MEWQLARKKNKEDLGTIIGKYPWWLSGGKKVCSLNKHAIRNLYK